MGCKQHVSVKSLRLGAALGVGVPGLKLEASPTLFTLGGVAETY